MHYITKTDRRKDSKNYKCSCHLRVSKFIQRIWIHTCMYTNKSNYLLDNKLIKVLNKLWWFYSTLCNRIFSSLPVKFIFLDHFTCSMTFTSVMRQLPGFFKKEVVYHIHYMEIWGSFFMRMNAVLCISTTICNVCDFFSGYCLQLCISAM